ncbi:spherulation-specific family 4 protein [Noviherbaspirillum sp.]|mgnify:CR=1 FL=1|jgi:hypothetical protein|uniref:spherulation-specific family 4 protein n=1 Tax=Noviherbaspirillum sp. TaxID=1926288 RepID=UPI0025FDE3F9|nr:spherulation-specific family 4 protein [Noviherbaspirillum sp.]
MKSLLLLIAALLASSAASANTDIGVISYWGTNQALYDQLPEGSVALVNPDNGIFVSAGQTKTLVPNLSDYKTIVRKAARRDIAMLGYVPTGYFNHTCDAIGQCQTWERIEAQVQAYFTNMPRLEGIFFDEAAPAAWDCNAFPAEYQRLRDIVYKYKDDATIAFNAGVPDNCAVAGAEAGDILVLFESDQNAYAAQAQNIQVSTTTALNKGVTTWHLIHSVKTVDGLNAVFAQAKATNVDLFYATDIGGNWQAGENTWGSLPSYWQQEVALLSGASEQLAPTCSSLASAPSGQIVSKVRWEDVGKPGYIYIGARDTNGHTWMHDGRTWTEYTSGTRSVYTSQTITGLLSLPYDRVSALLSTLPATPKAVWTAYALADDRDHLKRKKRICVNR